MRLEGLEINGSAMWGKTGEVRLVLVLRGEGKGVFRPEEF